MAAAHHQDFQPPYFPPPFPPTHHHQHHQSSTATSPSAMDYLSDPYSQTLSLQNAQVAAAHYNQLTVAAVSAGQRHDALRRADTADSIHVVRLILFLIPRVQVLVSFFRVIIDPIPLLGC